MEGTAPGEPVGATDALPSHFIGAPHNSTFVAQMSEASARRRYLLWRSLGTVLEQLPVQLAVRVAELMGAAIGQRSTSARTAVHENLRSVLEFGADEPVDPRVLDRFTTRAFASYARYWAEGSTLPAQRPGLMHSRIDMVEGTEALTKAMHEGNGVVVALPHVGSWEWGGALLARMGFPMTAVAEQLDPPELFDWFVAKRRAIGLEIEPLDQRAGTVMLSTLKAGGLVGLLCDRDLTGDGIGVEMFGRTVQVPTGPATLALRTGAALFGGVVYSGPGAQHTAHIIGPIPTEREGRLRGDITRVTQLLADEVAGLIARRPEQWHVFSDAFARGGEG